MGVSYEQWEREILKTVSTNGFTAISLHDCYGAHWLPRYRGLLDQLTNLGELRTLDEVAAEATLASGS